MQLRAGDDEARLRARGGEALLRAGNDEAQDAKDNCVQIELMHSGAHATKHGSAREEARRWIEPLIKDFPDLRTMKCFPRSHFLSLP